MEPTSSASIDATGVARLPGAVLAVRWLFGLLIAVSLLRAMTQSVTPGEAWNYDRFVGPPWTESLSRFDANNHVINTLLVRISTKKFHLTELSLRLPSLLAGLLYLLAVYRLARRWFGEGFQFLLVAGLLSLNPLVLDALSEARGYGMALSAWMWALCLILEATQRFSMPKLNLAAVCLGLSVVASLAFAAPACALLLVACLWFGADGRRHHLPALMLLTIFALLAIPINRADWTTLAVGSTSLRRTLAEMVAGSLGTTNAIFNALVRVLMGGLSVAGAWFALRFCRRSGDALLVFTGAVLPITLLCLILSRRYLHTPYPEQGALYLIPVSFLFISMAILKLRWNPAQVAYRVLCCSLLFGYAALFPVGPYRAGQEFAGARTLAKSLRARAGTAIVRVGVSRDAEPVLSYYRWRYRQANWQIAKDKPVNESYDYYVLTPRDAALIDQRHLHVLWRDRGLTLAQ